MYFPWKRQQWAARLSQVLSGTSPKNQQKVGINDLKGLIRTIDFLYRIFSLISNSFVTE